MWKFLPYYQRNCHDVWDIWVIHQELDDVTKLRQKEVQMFLRYCASILKTLNVIKFFITLKLVNSTCYDSWMMIEYRLKEILCKKDEKWGKFWTRFKKKYCLHLNNILTENWSCKTCVKKKGHSTQSP